jgi:hypothetical protein
MKWPWSVTVPDISVELTFSASLKLRFLKVVDGEEPWIEIKSFTYR